MRWTRQTDHSKVTITGMIFWLIGQAQFYAPHIQKICFLLGASFMLCAVIRAALLLKLISVTEFIGSLSAFLPNSWNIAKLIIVITVIVFMGIRSAPAVRQDRLELFGFLVCALNAIGFAFMCVPAYLAASGCSILLLVRQCLRQEDKDATLFAVLEAVFVVLAIGELYLQC